MLRSAAHGPRHARDPTRGLLAGLLALIAFASAAVALAAGRASPPAPAAVVTTVDGTGRFDDDGRRFARTDADADGDGRGGFGGRGR